MRGRLCLLPTVVFAVLSCYEYRAVAGMVLRCIGDRELRFIDAANLHRLD